MWMDIEEEVGGFLAYIASVYGLGHLASPCKWPGNGEPQQFVSEASEILAASLAAIAKQPQIFVGSKLQIFGLPIFEREELRGSGPYAPYRYTFKDEERGGSIAVRTNSPLPVEPIVVFGGLVNDEQGHYLDALSFMKLSEYKNMAPNK